MITASRAFGRCLLGIGNVIILLLTAACSHTDESKGSDGATSTATAAATPASLPPAAQTQIQQMNQYAQQQAEVYKQRHAATAGSATQH